MPWTIPGTNDLGPNGQLITGSGSESGSAQPNRTPDLTDVRTLAPDVDINGPDDLGPNDLSPFGPGFGDTRTTPEAGVDIAVSGGSSTQLGIITASAEHMDNKSTTGPTGPIVPALVTGPEEMFEGTTVSPDVFLPVPVGPQTTMTPFVPVRTVPPIRIPDWAQTTRSDEDTTTFIPPRTVPIIRLVVYYSINDCVGPGARARTQFPNIYFQICFNIKMF